MWLTLYLMGVSAGLANAVLLESLSLAARSAAFLIPSGWGAQEGALIALAILAGLPANTGLALGLVKRAREFAIGLPGSSPGRWPSAIGSRLVSRHRCVVSGAAKGSRRPSYPSERVQPKGKFAMIDVHYWPTPNGKKVTHPPRGMRPPLQNRAS